MKRARAHMDCTTTDCLAGVPEECPYAMRDPQYPPGVEPCPVAILLPGDIQWDLMVNPPRRTRIIRSTRYATVQDMRDFGSYQTANVENALLHLAVDVSPVDSPDITHTCVWQKTVEIAIERYVIREEGLG